MINTIMFSFLMILICAPFEAYAQIMCVDDWNCSGIIEFNTGRSPDRMNCRRVMFKNGDMLLEAEVEDKGKHYSSRSLLIEPNHIEISQGDEGAHVLSGGMTLLAINVLKAAYPNGPDTVPDGKAVRTAKMVDAKQTEQFLAVSTERVSRHQINYSIKNPNVADAKVTGLWNEQLSEPLPDDFNISGWSNSAKARFKILSDARSLRPDYKGYKVAKGYTITPLNTVGHTSNDIILWTNGKIQNLDNPGGKPRNVKGINSIGQVVGVTYPDGAGLGKPFIAVLWNRGKMQDLGPLGGRSSEANAINDAGQVVGHAEMSGNRVWHAVVWNSGKIQDLDPQGKMNSHAYGINNTGQIVGVADMKPVIWNNGIMQTLSPKTTGYAYAINDVGQVAGSADFNGDQHAVLWSNGKMLDLDPLGVFSSSTSINRLGQVVGNANTGKDQYNHAFLWSNGTATDLNTLPNHAGWEFLEAKAINDKGEIVVIGENNDHNERWFILAPDFVNTANPSSMLAPP